MSETRAKAPRTIDDTSYGWQETERKWQDYWESASIYRFDPGSDKPVFSIDTPPPTVSGDLHIGHVFSYTQAEIIARFMRMRGHNVFYPFGFDDNGLPTERLVERELGKGGRELPREAFIASCLEISRRYEGRFQALWKGLGFSVEWSRLYSTIDPRSRRISQRSFLELYRRGLVYRKAAPTLYCPNCRTSVAQAEAEDRSIDSAYLTIFFELPGGGRLPISTTRPELLPALAAVFVHPKDGRYARLVGGRARDPLFGIEAPIIADGAVEPERGSGAVMCCAYGDTQDLDWFRIHGLEPMPAIGQDGRLGAGAGEFAGLGIREARERISAKLLERGLAEAGPALRHAVNVHERCGTELEFVEAEEWFVNILDHKAEFEGMAEQIVWRPAFMKERYLEWVRNLRWDWCLSRQRSYGLPFPLWYCASCGAVRLAEEEALPVDPLASRPSRPCACGSGDFLPERDVMDTWATSSLSPEINARWGEGEDLSRLIQPFSLRPQAHDIIRTWAFYTIVKSYFHHGRAPWKEIMISGHSRDPRGNKISKSKGNAGASPAELAAKFGADPIRYWAASARLGTDSAFSEKTVAEGRKLVLKLWNAAQFAAPLIAAAGGSRPAEAASCPRAQPLEEWILASFRATAARCTAALERRDYDEALEAAERFFRRSFCDQYLELCKPLCRREGGNLLLLEGGEAEGAASAMREVLSGSLRLFAPFLPHIAEELYQGLFRRAEGFPSIHLAPWPAEAPLEGDEEKLARGAELISLVEAVRKAKTARRLSLAAPVAELAYALNLELLPAGFPETLSLSRGRIGGMLRIEAWRELAWGSEDWAGGREGMAIHARFE